MEFVTGIESYLESGLLPYYYAIGIILALYILKKFKFNKEAIFIVFAFYEGFFHYLSHYAELFEEIYKIGIVLFALYLFLFNYLQINKNKYEQLFSFVFFTIGILYIHSIFVNEDSILMNLSQYLRKHGVPFLFYFWVKKYRYSKIKMEWYAKLFIWLLMVQIILNVWKYFLFGFGESLVGSISYRGGAPGNVIPVLGFFLIWIRTKGILKKRDWIFVILLFLTMAIIGNKRSIWFTMSLMMLYTFFVTGGYSIQLGKLLKYAPLIILLFYVGVKSNPSLNPEQSRWGTFDINYIYTYAFSYLFGEKESEEYMSHGRGGANVYYLNNVLTDLNSSKGYLGYGVEEIKTMGYEQFSEEVDHSYTGGVSAFVSNFIMLGLIGTISIFLFGALIARQTKNNKFFFGLLAFLAFDYFLFYNSTITINADALLFVFIAFYYNSKFEGIKKRKNE